MTKKFRIVEQCRDRRYFQKPSDKKRLHKQKVDREIAKNNAKKKAKEKYI